MPVVFQKTSMLTDTPTHYCPGCGHGIIHRLVAESIEELGIAEKTVGICPVGCAVFEYNYMNCDMVEAAHGRAPAIATGLKRARPDLTVFTYQGDGDLASIGAGEINHAAARGEKVTTIFVNNAIYGMTGGQMAPTTLLEQRSTTTPSGRSADVNGYPMRVCEMLSAHLGVYYLARVSVDSTKNILDAKKCIKKAFEYQVAGKGFNFVEILSSCPTNWGMTPGEAMDWVAGSMMKVYPLGTFIDRGTEATI